MRPTGETRPLSPVERVRAWVQYANFVRVSVELIECRQDIGSIQHREELVGQLVKLQTQLSLGGDLTTAAGQSSAHMHAVGHLRALLGKACKVRPDDLDGLKSLLTRAKRGEKAALREAFSSGAELRTSERMRKEFELRPTKFFDTYLRGGSRSCAPDHATRSDGSVTLDPAEYIPMIGKIVSRPFSTKVHLPDAVSSCDSLDPNVSTDIRATGVRPTWWDQMYDRSARGVPTEIFEHLMDSVSAEEVRLCIAECSEGKSPGIDGCGIDLLKLLVGTSDTQGQPTASLTAFTTIINHCLALSFVPPLLKHGIITLVPKVKEDGSASKEVDKMRPITVLPELGKITSRILAKRLGTILLKRPGLLSDAQRAFLRDGCVDQCVNVVLDVVEDWTQRANDKDHPRRKQPLFLISYDQAKAFDSIQIYTIRASLERFNLPESFIQYVISGLTDAKSQVRTYDGLSEPFLLRSSVRQGDPLSPLIYILITDALHAGLAKNPLFPETADKGGYTFSRSDLAGAAVRVCSSGYADDTATMTDDSVRLTEMHTWVRSFYGAHAFTLNCDKSKFLCSTLKNTPTTLTSVDGKTIIEPIPPTSSVTAAGCFANRPDCQDGLTWKTLSSAKKKPFKKAAKIKRAHLQKIGTIRYLGVWFNLELNWDVQIARMNKVVQLTCVRIRDYHFPLDMSVVATQQFIAPCVRSGLIFTDVSESRLKKWDSVIRSSAMQAYGMKAGRSLKAEAWLIATDLVSLQDLRWVTRGEELMVTLNASYPSTRTCWARLGNTPWAPTQEARQQSRAAETIGRLMNNGVYLDFYPTNLHLPLELASVTSIQPLGPAWQPDRAPVLFTRPNFTEGSRTIYTDGSTGPDPKRPAGCAVIVCNEAGAIIAKIRFRCRATGNNYLPELLAILCALVLTPSDVDVRIHSDALGALYGINKGRDRSWPSGKWLSSYALPQRARLLAGMRPVRNCIEAVICRRAGATELFHVKAHTMRSDQHSRMNEVADREANRARIEKGTAVPYELFGQELVRMKIRASPHSRPLEVLGSYRQAMLRMTRSRYVSRLAEPRSQNGYQHRMARIHGRGVATLCETVRLSHDPRGVRFSTLAIAEKLPTMWRAAEFLPASPTEGLCVLCTQTSTEDIDHVYMCTNVTRARMRDATIAATVGLLVGAGVTSPRGSPGSQRVRAWFDPLGRAGNDLWVCSRVPSWAIAGIESLTPYDGALGIMPAGISKLLGFTWTRSHGWTTCGLAEVGERQRALQDCIVRGALRTWQTRCSELDEWWRGNTSTEHRQHALEMRVQRAANKIWNASAREARKKQKKPPPKLKGRPATGSRAPKPVGPDGRTDRSPSRRERRQHTILWHVTDSTSLAIADARNEIQGHTPESDPSPSWY
jgi:ribonuclease HI